MVNISRSLILLLAFFGCFSTSAEETIIATASNFSAAMDEIIAEFEAQTDHDVRVSYGSSGMLYAQIVNGAPFDIFFSADREKPLALEADGLAVTGSRFTYATGALVLWSRNPELDLRGGEILLRGNFNRLSLANPRLAPYGAAAVDVLDNLGALESTRGKWVQGENIVQAFQFAYTANADLGFVALSQVLGNGLLSEGSAWIVPETMYNPIRQEAVLLKRGENNLAATDFLAFMRGISVKAIIEEHGYRNDDNQ